MKYIIYGILDPRLHKKDQLRYIGKSEQGTQRFKEHLKSSSLKNNLPKDNWIKKCLNLNLKPKFIILESFSSADELFEAEEFYYLYFKSLGCDLLNLTECGKGTNGYKHREETIKLLKEKAKLRDQTPYQIPHNKKENIIINNEIYRNCTKCKLDQKIDLFIWNKKKDQYIPYCKPCRAKHRADWVKKNPRPKLSKEEYLKSHLKAIRAGGEAMKRPEQRLRQALAKSKPIQAHSPITGETLTFSSALKAKESGFQNSNIGQAIKYKTLYRGYYWKFI